MTQQIKAFLYSFGLLQFRSLCFSSSSGEWRISLIFGIWFGGHWLAVDHGLMIGISSSFSSSSSGHWASSSCNVGTFTFFFIRTKGSLFQVRTAGVTSRVLSSLQVTNAFVVPKHFFQYDAAPRYLTPILALFGRNISQSLSVLVSSFTYKSGFNPHFTIADNAF